MKHLLIISLMTSIYCQQASASSMESGNDLELKSCNALNACSDAGDAASTASHELAEFIEEHAEELKAAMQVGISVSESAIETHVAIQTLNYPLLMLLATKAMVVESVMHEAKVRTARQVVEREIHRNVDIKLLYIKNFRDILLQRGDLALSPAFQLLAQ